MSNPEENPTFGQANHTLTIVGQQNPTADNLRTLHDGYLAALMQGIKAGKVPELSAFRDFVMGTSALTTTTFSVDYAKSLPEMIAACGFDWNHPDITTENFPVVETETGVVEMMEYKLFHFGRTLASGELEALIAADDSSRPWVPANLPWLLAYGAANPGEQRKFPIVALGSAAKVARYRHVPCLYGSDTERYLGLDWFDHDWNGSYRFLAVRPVLKPLVA